MSNRAVEIEMDFTYSTDVTGLDSFWRDVGKSLGAFNVNRVEIHEQNKDAEAKKRTVTARAIYNTPEETLVDVLEVAHKLLAGTSPLADKSNAPSYDAIDTALSKARWVDGTRWESFEQTDPTYVIEASGETIEVPDNILVIEDPKDAPTRIATDVPNGEKSQKTHQVVDAREAYTSGQPFAIWERYEDFHSSAWYSSVVPNPGSADREWEKQGEDEATAVRRAISLAKRYSIPVLLR